MSQVQSHGSGCTHTTLGAKLHRNMVVPISAGVTAQRKGLQKINDTKAARTNGQGGPGAICRISRAIRRCSPV